MKLQHPTSGRVVNVKPERAERLLERGYTKYESKTDKKSKAKAAKASSKAGGSDPAAEVLTFIGQAGDDELLKVAVAAGLECNNRGLIPEVDVPEDVTPGETPGWPICEDTGRVFDLPDQVRAELAAAAESEEDEDADEKPEAPALSASKADWQEYAKKIGVDSEGLTKPKIIEACEAKAA